MKSLRIVKIIFITALPLVLTACSSIGYYSQSVIGHNKIMWARKSVDKIIETAEEPLRTQLVTAQQIRQYAIDHLALPDNDSYSTYVNLPRDYPVWSVVAAEEFSMQAREWCYPVIGCASYRGYFSEQSALDYAEALKAKGFETTVGGAVAYSTLGWFSDPLLPSMLRYGEAYLAETVFHELAHQVLYVNGNSAFNEAFASVVGEQGALQWLAENSPELLEDYQQKMVIYNEFVDLLNGTKEGLINVYSQEVSVQQKRQMKQQVIEKLKENYELKKANDWQNQGYFDSWFEKSINNARLASVSTYRDQMPPLHTLLVACDYDFANYFSVLKRITDKYPQDQILTNLPEQCDMDIG